MPKPRSLLARGATLAAFAAQQLRQRRRVEAEIAAMEAQAFAIEAPTITLSASETSWRPTGLRVKAGDRFTVSARGAVWILRPLALVMEPKSTLWVRIAGASPIEKPADNDHVFTAWAEGEVEVFLKGLSEWASPAGDLLSPRRAPASGRIRVRLARVDDPATISAAPDGWRYLWRLGDGTVYEGGDQGAVTIRTLGDVGILQTEVDHVLTPQTRLAWSWRVQTLPSRLAEDIALTHDYLSVAVEFDDGRDLTFMWSSALPHDHIFACPLGYWCDWETHWVVRTPADGLGVWHDERRDLWSDTQRAYGERPRRIVRLWLIANSIFQRSPGVAEVRALRVDDAG